MAQYRTPLRKVATPRIWAVCALLSLGLAACTATPTPGPAPSQSALPTSSAATTCLTPTAELTARTDVDKQLLVVQYDTFGSEPTTSSYPQQSFTPQLSWQGAEPVIDQGQLLALLGEALDGVSLDLTPITATSTEVSFADPAGSDTALSYRFVQPQQLDYTVSCAGDATEYPVRAVQASEFGTVVLDCAALPADENEPLSVTVREAYC